MLVSGGFERTSEQLQKLTAILDPIFLPTIASLPKSELAEQLSIAGDGDSR